MYRFWDDSRFGRRVIPSASALRHYLPAILVEVALFAMILAVFQLSGYGRQPGRLNNVPLGLLFVILAWGIAEARFQLYRRVWPVAGFADAVAIAWAVALASALITMANAVLPDAIRPFRYLVPPLAAPAAAATLCLYRLWPRLRAAANRGGRRLLVVCADSAAFPLIRSMILHTPSGWEPVAILTSDAADRGRTINGVPVAGPVDEIDRWRHQYRADGVAFISRGPLTGTWKELVGRCLGAELPIFVVPEIEELLHPAMDTPLRSLTADDLVGRERRDIDLESARDEVRERNVMVTGAAGSIGSELSRLLVSLRPRQLVLLDNNESGLFEIAAELRSTAPELEIREALVSIADRRLLQSVFTDVQPDIVFHAAAYKHVPMLEAHPEQAVATNVMGTRNALACAEKVGTRTFVLVSTDKAVSRQSIMGCTKRMCEMLVLSFAGGTNSWAVRFGNVVGSRGSVVPTFERQILSGGPVTITDPACTRYMMTIREAATLVISTLTLGRRGHLYMLDMGEPISIDRLARSLIRSRGLSPGTDIAIMYTGLRPGEALTEDLLAPEEGSRPTTNPAVLEVISTSLLPVGDLRWVLDTMDALLTEGRTDELVRLLKTAAGGALDSDLRPAGVSESEERAVRPKRRPVVAT